MIKGNCLQNYLLDPINQIFLRQLLKTGKVLLNSFRQRMSKLLQEIMCIEFEEIGQQRLQIIEYVDLQHT